MSRATKVFRVSQWDTSSRTFIFEIENNFENSLIVSSYKNGFAHVTCLANEDIERFAETVAGCFCENSNFKEMLDFAFLYEKHQVFKGIIMHYNGEIMEVIQENANKEKIYARWRCKALKHEKEDVKAYLETPSYKLMHKVELEMKDAREQASNKLKNISKKTKFEFKNDEAEKYWSDFVQINSSDLYGRVLIQYAEIWAKYMQHLMNEKKETLKEVVAETESYCKLYDVTGNMYGEAAAILARCWKHGDELRVWHNNRFGIKMA